MVSRFLLFTGIGLLAGVALCLALPTQPYLLNLVAQALVWGLLAASWDILGGYSGLVSFGHAGFFALGAYIAGLVQLHFGLSVLWSLLIATAVSGMTGLIVGFPALRLRGHYLALVTLAFGESVQLIARNWQSVTGGNFGLQDFGGFDSTPMLTGFGPKAPLMVILIIVGSVIAALLYLVRFSPTGRAFLAVREDEILTESLGINSTYYKLMAFVVSAACAGLAGSIYAGKMGLVTPSLSSVGSSALIVGMVIFGGIGSVWGAFIGGVLLFGIIEALRFVGVIFNLMAVGTIMIVFVVALPGGLAGIRWRRAALADRADWAAKRTSSGEDATQ